MIDHTASQMISNKATQPDTTNPENELVRLLQQIKKQHHQADLNFLTHFGPHMLQLSLQEWLYYHASNSAALLLLFRKKPLKFWQDYDQRDLIIKHTENEEHWHKKLWFLILEDESLQLTVADLHSELYKVLTAGFYMFYLARLPYLLKDAVWHRCQLDGTECLQLADMCQYQIPAEIHHHLENYYEAHCYLLDQLQRDRKNMNLLAWTNVFGADTYIKDSTWLFRLLDLTGLIDSFLPDAREEEEDLSLVVEDVINIMMDSFRERCQNLPRLDETDEEDDEDDEAEGL